MYYKLGQACVTIGAALFYCKLGKTLLQIGASVVTNWGQLLQIRATVITNRGITVSPTKLFTIAVTMTKHI